MTCIEMRYNVKEYDLNDSKFKTIFGNVFFCSRL